MRKYIYAIIVLLSCLWISSSAQIDTTSTRRTTVSGFSAKIITDAHLRAASSMTIPYINSTTPSMNGAINRAGYGLQLLSNGRLAIGAGASTFFQFINFTEYTTANNLKANLASPTFTGTVTLPTGTVGVTQTAGNSTTALATTAFVTAADNLKSNIASPSFTGTPLVPTAAVGTNTTQAASTAFVLALLQDRIKYGSTLVTFDGSQTVFNLPHGMSTTPTSISITFGDAANDNFVKSVRTITSTNIVLTCDTPPLIGSQTVYWQAYK